MKYLLMILAVFCLLLFQSMPGSAASPNCVNWVCTIETSVPMIAAIAPLPSEVSVAPSPPEVASSAAVTVTQQQFATTRTKPVRTALSNCKQWKPLRRVLKAAVHPFKRC